MLGTLTGRELAVLAVKVLDAVDATTAELIRLAHVGYAAAGRAYWPDDAADYARTLDDLRELYREVEDAIGRACPGTCPWCPVVLSESPAAACAAPSPQDAGAGAAARPPGEGQAAAGGGPQPGNGTRAAAGAAGNPAAGARGVRETGG